MKFIATEFFQDKQAAELAVVVKNGTVASMASQSWFPLPANHLPPNLPIVSRTPLGYLDNKPCESLFIDSSDFAPGHFPDIEWLSLRDLLTCTTDVLFQLAGRAVQFEQWVNQHQFCGRCGVGTVPADNDRSLVCPGCELRFYPKISPCVIMLISRGDECLLARGVRHPEGLYSTLAGFIEAGESAEQAVFREVFEEVSLKIKNLRYFASQPWPFPGQLMLAFTADYDTGDIRIDPKEIIDARWFHYKQLPFTPPTFTISGRLIADFIANREARRV